MQSITAVKALSWNEQAKWEPDIEALLSSQLSSIKTDHGKLGKLGIGNPFLSSEKLKLF